MPKIRITSRPPQNREYDGSISENSSLPKFETRRTLSPESRESSNIEAERGETVLMPDQGGLPAQFNVGGNRHYNGGTPLNVPKDSFVFSDTKKMRIKDPNILAEFGKSKGSYTPADLAKKYDINKYRKILQDPDSDKLDVNTAEKMIANYELKLAKLALVQESKKGFRQGIPAVAMPYLATFNLSPDSILPLKAENQEVQDIPYEDVTNQARYGMQYPKAQQGFNAGTGYIDMEKNPFSTGARDPLSGGRGTGFDPGMTTYFDTTPEGFQVSKDEQFNPENKLYDYSQSLQPSFSQEGVLKEGFRMNPEDAVNWGIAGMGVLSNIFSQDERRNAEDQLARRFKAENIYTSREDRDRGDWTPNQGYFRPDQKSTGRMITGKYGREYQLGGPPPVPTYRTPAIPPFDINNPYFDKVRQARNLGYIRNNPIFGQNLSSALPNEGYVWSPSTATPPVSSGPWPDWFQLAQENASIKESSDKKTSTVLAKSDKEKKIKMYMKDYGVNRTTATELYNAE